MLLEKISRMALLKDFYGPLLTHKQQEVVSLYYESDWSFSEIAGQMGVTRQAVYDLLRRAEQSLEDYEKRLGLVEKFLETRRQIEQVYDLLESEKERPGVSAALKILRNVNDSV